MRVAIASVMQETNTFVPFSTDLDTFRTYYLRRGAELFDGFGSAREYFAGKNSTYKRNQFGGTVGGAILKNKLFYFGGYQSTIRRENPNSAAGCSKTPPASPDFMPAATRLSCG